MSALPDRETTAANRRKFAQQVVERLREAGYEALWAGGCVRDLLLELAPMDYDVATSATPDQVREVFGSRRTLPVGAAFGVIIVLGPHAAAGQVEVATFRNDTTYSDGRRPDAVVFSTPIEDAQRRDFTINGMFYDPLSQQVIDYVGGRHDLERGLIRAIGDADARIAEDKLRMLRAVRFAARFGFAIEASTQAALARHAAELCIVSGERMAGEMHKTLVTSGRESAVRNWAEAGLLAVLLPELAQHWSERGEHACALVRAIRPDDWICPLAALLWPITALPQNIQQNSPADSSPDIQPETNAAGAAALSSTLKARLKLSNDEVARLRFALESQPLLQRAAGRAWSEVQPVLVDPRIAAAMDLLAARVACGEVDAEQLEWLEQRLAWPRERLDPPPLVGGNDLQRLGFAAGPQFKQLLASVRAGQLDARLADRQQALQWLQTQLPKPAS
ncbi:MAG: CCA tRNA nucleotidyltransferase [Aureliella sp.]